MNAVDELLTRSSGQNRHDLAGLQLLGAIFAWSLAYDIAVGTKLLLLKRLPRTPWLTAKGQFIGMAITLALLASTCSAYRSLFEK